MCSIHDNRHSSIDGYLKGVLPVLPPGFQPPLATARQLPGFGSSRQNGRVLPTTLAGRPAKPAESAADQAGAHQLCHYLPFRQPPVSVSSLWQGSLIPRHHHCLDFASGNRYRYPVDYASPGPPVDFASPSQTRQVEHQDSTPIPQA